MKHILLLVASFLLLFSGVTRAQEKWDLRKCINYALDNNIQIKQQSINAGYYNNQLKQAKNNMLPSLSGSLSNSFNFGRTLQSDNTYANFNSNQTGGGLSANLMLWNGLILRNSIEKAKLDLQASQSDLQKSKDDIMLYIAAAYLEILMDQELEQVAQDQIDVTKMQIDRTKKLVDAGSLAKGSLLEIQAQLASEELNLVTQQNSLQLAYLNLYQLLELPSTEKFTIEKPVLPVVTANRTLLNSMDVFNNAVKIMPEVKSAEYRLGGYKEQVAIAKGSLYPSVSVGANYNNYYNDRYPMSFQEQMKSNERYYVGASMNIPIFNKLQARTQIDNAKLQVMNQELEVQNTKNTLRKDIEQAYTNALAALKKYVASNKAVESMQEAFRYTEEKYNVGMVNSVEYNQAKNNLTKAKSDLAQAKYDYIFRTKILDFYNGNPIEL
ncbi:MAG TPA: TolC family protein [Sunxiuqinia sp.]|nr:TolC family protein [Sunxiuqinia sp.]